MADENPVISSTEESKIADIENMLKDMRVNKTQRYMDMPMYVYDGLLSAVEEYKKTYLNRESKEGLYKADPLAYYNLQREGLTIDTKQYYDVSKAETSNIDSDVLYKMFAKQVVEGLKKDKIITLPETWDIGSYYTGVGKDAINMYSQTYGQDLDVKQLQGNANIEFQKTMQARIDYMVNEASDDDLYKEFNQNTLSKFSTQNRSNAQLIYDGFKSLISPNKEEVSIPEYNGAAGFGRVLQKSLQSGKRLSSDIYINENYLPQQQGKYEQTTDVNMPNNPMYMKGRVLAQQNKSGEYNSYIKNQIFNMKSLNTNDYNAIMKGYYDELDKQGVKISQGEHNVPTAVRSISLKRKLGKSGYEYSVGNEATGQEIGYSNLPQPTKDYIDRIEYMRRLTGDLETAQKQIGRAYVPEK